MIVSTIKFIGLLVTTFLTNPSGVQVVMGNFAPIVPPHTQLIAWPEGTRVALPPQEEWPTNGKFTDKRGVKYEYSLVTVQNVTIDGPTEEFGVKMDKIPHLTCCCQQFISGLNPQWGDPGYSGPGGKKSAFFAATHGTYTTFLESTGAVSTALGFTQQVDITFIGVAGGSTKKIKVHPQKGPNGEDYVLYVANTPLAVLEGKPVHGPDDFKSFYRMGDGTQSCTAQPGNPPPNPCAPSSSACGREPGAKASSRLKKLVEQIRKILKPTRIAVDMNCSSSQWP